MDFLDWRIGVWLFALGLIGVLLPTFESYAPPACRSAPPLWPFYILLAAGAILTGIGAYRALKKRTRKKP